MASSDALPVARKNVAYRVVFPIFDADGDLVSGATGLDSEISKDQGTFADCTNEATEIASSSGMYYLDLTSTEMNADCAAIIVKTTSVGAKTTPLVIYPEELGDYRINPQTIWDALTSALTTASSIGKLLVDNINATISSRSSHTVADVWNALTSGLSTANSIGKLLVDNVNASISAVKTQTDKMVFTVANQLDVNVLDWKSATAPAMTGDAFARLGAPAGASTAADIAAVKALLPAALTADGNMKADALRLGGTVQTGRDIGASVLVGDKTGFSLSAGGVQAIWDALTSALTTSGSIGKLLVDNINASISAIKTQTDKMVFTVANMLDVNVLDWKGATAPAMTGDAFARLGAPAGASVSADLVAVKSDTGAVKTQTDKMVFTVANMLDVNVLDWKGATAPAMTGDAFARLGAPAGVSTAADIAAVKSDTGAIKTKTDNLPSDPADASDIAGAFGTVNSTLATIASYVDTEIGAIYSRIGAPAGASIAADIAASKSAVDAVKGVIDKLEDTLEPDGSLYRFTADALAEAPTGSGASVSDIADAVWDEPITDHVSTGGTSVADALAAAGSAGDPWATLLPGTYSVGQAGKIVGDALDAAISSRATPAQAADAVWDEPLAPHLTTAGTATADQLGVAPLLVSEIETGLSFLQAMRGMSSVLLGKVTGVTTGTETFRNAEADSVDRVVSHIDINGNRTAVDLTL